MPTPNAGFLARFRRRHGRSGECDASILAEIDLMLDPGAQFLAVMADELGPMSKTDIN
jgi:hypothetical protein